MVVWIAKQEEFRNSMPEMQEAVQNLKRWWGGAQRKCISETIVKEKSVRGSQQKQKKKNSERRNMKRN